MFNGKGKLHYDDKDGFRVTLEVGQDFANYYYSLIPKYFSRWKQGWPTHITVIRPEYEIPPKLRCWGDYEGEEIGFIYDPYIQCGNGFYWLNCWSKRFEDIQDELGLPKIISKYSLRPAGFDKTFHITIGKCQQISVDINNGPEP